jgi:hypothetical protein
VDTSPVIEDWPAQNGVIRPNLNPAERPQWPEAIYLITHKTRQSYTMEAPSDFPLPARVAALARRRAGRAGGGVQWQERSRAIREQILVSSGLWPMPEKTPLHAVISARLSATATVSKGLFPKFPRFLCRGNLYRPLGKGAGPFPAILNPHGHWEHGRLEDTTIAALPGRCINFAKQGMIAFAYDMVGLQRHAFSRIARDTAFSDKHHSFASNSPANLALERDVDGLANVGQRSRPGFPGIPAGRGQIRLACTGASGGGTQTFILGAIDDRLAAQAPVVMVSHTMQGGCLCENMPGLRVEFSNMEIAAAAAPRPQILVSDTGDWTKTNAHRGRPGHRTYLSIIQAPEKLRYVRFDFGHNYNQTSRQAVYQWFDRGSCMKPDQPVAEQAFQKEPDQDLLRLSRWKAARGRRQPKRADQYLIKMHRDQLQSISPTNGPSLANYKRIIEPAWIRTLQLKWPPTLCGPGKGSVRKAGYISEEWKWPAWRK